MRILSRLAPVVVVAVLAASAAALSSQSARAADTAPAPLSLPCAAYPGGATVCSGEVASFDAVPDGAYLDVDVTKPMTGGQRHPLIVMLHGFGNNKHEWESTTDAGDGADKYHWNSHWFASHGYYVLTYTARGFTDQGPDRPDQPGTPAGTGPSCAGPSVPSPPSSAPDSDCQPAGTIRVKNKNVEIRDTQYLAALTAAAFPDIDRSAVAVTGGSYGGGESWLQAAHPIWDSFPGLPVLRLQVAIPKYPWTDLTYALAPNGHPGGLTRQDLYSSDQGSPLAKTGEGNPPGVEKQSYVGGLYTLGTTTGTFDPGTNASPQDMPPDPQVGPGGTAPYEPFSAWLGRLAAGEPYSISGGQDDPVVGDVRHAFSGWHSAYYQRDGWTAQQASGGETAIFSISGWTDDLFPPVESFRMFSYLKSLDPLWPVAVGVGDVGHSRAQNKPETWHRLNSQAFQFLMSQINGSHRQQTSVYREPTLCTGNTANLTSADQLTATTPEGLANGTLTVQYSTAGELTPFSGLLDPDGLPTDAVAGELVEPHADCRQSVAAASYTGYTAVSVPLPNHQTHVGIGHVDVPYTLSAPSQAVLAARLWDVAPDGTTLLVSRGVYRLDVLGGYNPPIGVATVPFYGNHWVFAPGHRIRLDLAQVDAPTYRPPNAPVTASISMSPPTLVLPVREAPSVTVAGS
ncbi:MAG: hypothetical protein NVSMB13_04980 [Mycobacteriales bacterium]